MTTVTILLTLLGFWLCYQTSKRAILSTSSGRLELWARSENSKAKAVGVLLMFIGLLLYINQLGVGAGLFGFVVLLGCVASIVILLAPLGILTYRNVLIVSIIALTLELLF